jgi:hypothetical protein
MQLKFHQFYSRYSCYSFYLLYSSQLVMYHRAVYYLHLFVMSSAPNQEVPLNYAKH